MLPGTLWRYSVIDKLAAGPLSLGTRTCLLIRRFFCVAHLLLLHLIHIFSHLDWWLSISNLLSRLYLRLHISSYDGGASISRLINLHRLFNPFCLKETTLSMNDEYNFYSYLATFMAYDDLVVTLSASK